MEDSTKKLIEIFEKIDEMDRRSKEAIMNYLNYCEEKWTETKDERKTFDGIAWSEASIWTVKHLKNVLQNAKKKIEGFKEVEEKFYHWHEKNE